MRELFAPPRRRRAFIALGALASVAVAAGIILGAGLSGTSAGASPPTKSAGATTVQRRDLVQTDTEPGTLSYANPHTVFNRLSGTVTTLPSVGQTITPGQTMYRVSGAPVVLMTGSVPAYRDLSQGVSDGADVQELEQNLVALGFDPSRQITVNQTFDAATAAAVDRWQATLGETQTGTVSLGQVVFLPGSQRVTAIDTALGSTGGSSSGSGSSSTGSTSGTGASVTPAPARPEFISLTTTTTSTTTSTTTPATGPPPGTPATKPTSGSGKSTAGTTASSLAALVALLRAEIAELKKSAASSTGASGKSGAAGASSGAGAAGGSAGKSSGAPAGSSGGGGGSSATGSAASGAASAASPSAQAIMQTTSTKLVVTVNLDATKQSEAVVGGPVTVQMPDGTTLDGKITAVSPVAQSSSTSSSSSSSGAGGSSTPTATVPITITLRNSRHVNGLDQAAVSVNFEQQKAKNVLSVPVSALLATAGGGYDVQEATAPHRLIPVTPGLFAAGFVQISGPQISPGLQVTDSQG
ncbi:MAG: hypothetical protein QOD66_3503 [Solirubrobacteraceae bacterium]|jgi:hypothetical protein|nr:hypothetical protein [Solirubrobacteraceae bacterium]